MAERRKQRRLRCGRLAHSLTSEAGIALPVSVAVLALTMLLGAVAVQQGIGAIDGSGRDSAVKRALQAANAGVETSLWRMNTFAEEVNDPLAATRCVVRVDASGSLELLGTETLLDGSQWCPAGVEEELGNGESYSYRDSGFDVDFDGLRSTIDRKVVSTGTVGGITRRVVARFSAFDVNSFFSDYIAFSKEDLTLDNQSDLASPEVQGSARSNGNISLNHPNAHIYGNATPGPGDSVFGPNGSSPDGQVDGSTAPAAEELEMPAVNMPAASEVDGQVCDVSLLLIYTCPSSSYDTTTRRLDVSGKSVVLRGNVFAFCSIRMTNSSTLRFQPTDLLAPVRIYIDSPDNCLDSSGNPPARSLSFENKPKLEWALDLLGISLQDLTYPTVQIYVVGDDPPTEIYYDNNNTSRDPEEVSIAMYAPNSNVTLNNHAIIEGGVIANQLTLRNNSAIVPTTGGVGNLVTGVTPLYDQKLFQECTAAPVPDGQAPDGGC